jgi:LDH2 family malate/lactate/ureidoglycolate dehydrogenase
MRASHHGLVKYMPTFSAEQLRTIGASIFSGLGVPVEDAELVSDLLVEANLTGFDSHGMIRIPIYCRGIKMGAVKPWAEIRIVEETPTSAVVDGGWNLGQVVAKYAMEVCIEKARNGVPTSIDPACRWKADSRRLFDGLWAPSL